MSSNLLLTLLVVYCIACYTITIWSHFACPDEGEDYEAREYFSGVVRQHPFRGALVILLFLLPLFLVVVPLVMPFCAVQCWLESRRETAEARKHVDFGFVWTNPDKLPVEARRYFDLRSPELLELGFQFEGAYRMKPRPDDYYGALFINKSGTTVATLIRLLGENSFAFSTVLESGRVVETAPIEATASFTRFADHPNYTVVLVPDYTIGAAYQKHQERLAELFWTTGDRPLAFDASQACDVLQYEGRLFSQQLHDLGHHDAPPAAVLPEAPPLTWEFPLFPEPEDMVSALPS